MSLHSQTSLGHRLLQSALTLAGSAALTLAFFLVLPLIQAIGEMPQPDTLLTSVETSTLPPPPPPVEPEPEQQEQPQEQPPELIEEAPHLDLADLSLALNPGFGDNWTGAGLSIDLRSMVESKKDIDALFSLADLDQKPRALYRPGPLLSARQRRATPGSVTLVFIVDQDGRVDSPVVMKSSNPVFERPALDAIKKWKFEPGKRNGHAVRFRLRQPITFPRS